MPKTSQAQLKASAKYQKEKTHKATVRLKNDEYQKLLLYCEKHNYTVGGLLRDRIKDIIHPNNDVLTEDHINPPDLTEDHINSNPGNTENS